MGGQITKDMTMTERQEMTETWARLGQLEKQSSAQAETNRNIEHSINEIRDWLANWQENSKPNMGVQIMVLIAACTFMVTVGTLALQPTKNSVGMLQITVAELQKEVYIQKGVTKERDRQESNK